MTGTLRGELCAFMIVSPLFLLKTTNVSSTFCRENQNSQFVFNIFFFPKSYHLCRNAGKYGKVRRISSVTKILINIPQIKFHG